MNKLLKRLMEGDLPSDEWPSIAASRKSLHVRISNLRSKGHEIDSFGDASGVTYRYCGPRQCPKCGHDL